MKDVLENLGEPKEKQENGPIWSYESACSCEIPNELSVAFSGGRVVELILSTTSTDITGRLGGRYNYPYCLIAFVTRSQKEPNLLTFGT